MNRYLIHTVLQILLFASMAMQGFCQVNEKSRAGEALKEAAAQYKATPSLSFDVKYRYADAESPAQYLDSLKGSFKINGDNIWYQLDATETIIEKGVAVILFQEDEIMYLSKNAPAAAQMLPLQSIDSLIGHEQTEGTIRQVASGSHITLQFSEHPSFKSMEYYIDAKTGWITTMRMHVKASFLYEQSVQALLEGEEKYVYVDIEFTNYRQNRYGQEVFATSKYFKREGDRVVSLPPYQHYKVFIGSPNF